MSGRLYDNGIDPKCGKCGEDMFTSQERNFNGAKCKNKKCDGGVLDAIYKPFSEAKKSTKPSIEIDENGKYILHGIFTTFGK